MLAPSLNPRIGYIGRPLPRVRVAQVQQGGAFSNSQTFAVNSVTVSSVSPSTNVAPGTQVTVTGSNFGVTQGTGQVWLGTAYGTVQSWSNTQIVASVAPGSLSGNAEVLQNGVWSPPVPFTIDALQVASITPTSGQPGASVTFRLRNHPRHGVAFAAPQAVLPNPPRRPVPVSRATSFEVFSPAPAGVMVGREAGLGQPEGP